MTTDVVEKTSFIFNKMSEAHLVCDLSVKAKCSAVTSQIPPETDENRFSKEKFSKKIHLKKRDLSNAKQKLHPSNISSKEITRKKISVHNQTHTKEKPYSCDVCNKKFTWKKNLKLHYRRIHLNKRIVCNTKQKLHSSIISSKEFSQENIDVHHQTHAEENLYSCDVCHKKFTRKVYLNQHYHTHAKEKPYSCDACSKEFTCKKYLDRHNETHAKEKPYSCDVCHKKFTCKGYLNQHYHTHTKEKSYSCDVCYKEFTCKMYFDRHYRTHAKEKPYFCDVCYQEFTLKKYVKQHYQRVHLNKPMLSDKKQKLHLSNISSNEFSQENIDVHPQSPTEKKLYSCDVCRKEFTRKRNLKTHHRTHTKEKPYFCNVCYEEFSLKGTLDRHYRIHTNEKPYSCYVCHKKFTQKGNLNNHLRTHTNEKPYSCDVCQKEFSQKSSLNRHTNRSHKNEK